MVAFHRLDLERSWAVMYSLDVEHVVIIGLIFWLKNSDVSIIVWRGINWQCKL